MYSYVYISYENNTVYTNYISSIKLYTNNYILHTFEGVIPNN